MKHLLSLALATLLTASNFLVAKGAPLESEQEAEISALCEKYSAAYKAKDASAITSLFIGAHPVLMPPNAPAAVGIEAIKSHYQSLFANRDSNLTGLEKLEVGGELQDYMVDPGNLAIIITASSEGHKYLTVLLRDSNKSWKIARLIWNSSQ